MIVSSGGLVVIRSMSATVVACLCLASTATALVVSPPSSYGVAASMRVWAASAPARSDSDRFTNSRRWSFEGGDLPSDVDADSSAAAPSVLAGDNPELRETIKREILSIAATSNRCDVHNQSARRKGELVRAFPPSPVHTTFKYYGHCYPSLSSHDHSPPV